MDGGKSNAPKTNKASKKNKKSWRKNVDMTDINEFLEEKRFEERVGGSFSERPDEELFSIEKESTTEPVKHDRKKEMKLKCLANLEGLPGAPDPMPIRNHTLKPEERENPIVKDMKLKKIRSGKIQKKYLESKANRDHAMQLKESKKDESMTRRRTKFDFDLWGSSEDSSSLPSSDWVKTEALIHSAQNTGTFVPKMAKSRKTNTGTLIPAVEVPDAGASYNPNVEDHQSLLWKAAIVEIEKEKENQKLERQTTAMFPSRKNAPTEKDYIQEMSEGIVELNGVVENEEKEEETIEKSENEKDPSLKCSLTQKPKTRKQKRDQRKRMFEEQKKDRDRNTKIRETEISRVKSINKKLKADEEQAALNEAKRKEALEKKMSGPLQLSNYKYEPQEIEIKLSDELTGNLRNMKQEGSLLEDRFKSLQRRNMIEVRVKQKTIKRLKRKTFEKRSHKMGWEENPNKTAKRIRKDTMQRRKAKID